MHPKEESQPGSGLGKPSGSGRVDELVVPNPKLKLMDQVREVLRVKHYSIRPERCYCDWIRRYIRYHRMLSREELFPGASKVEEFLRFGGQRPSGGFVALLLAEGKITEDFVQNIRGWKRSDLSAHLTGRLEVVTEKGFYPCSSNLFATTSAEPG